MKTSLFSFLSIIILSLGAHAQSNSTEADKIVGTWLTSEGKAKIIITKYGEKFGGKITWLKTP